MISFTGLFNFLVLIIILLFITKPLGLYLYRVFNGKQTWLDPVLTPIESMIYRLIGIKAHEEQSVKRYLFSLLIFNFIGFLVLILMLISQALLPLNPANAPQLTGSLAFNTAASFVTNTNWQAYAGERQMSYLSQVMGLSVQNFFSAATGLCVIITLIRTLSRSRATTVGNFWQDLTRSILWVLLPFSFLLALLYLWQGIPDNLNHYVTVHQLDGGINLIPQGPIASQEAIKSLGTNGGGFFNAGSAHPYENPTPITNFLQILSMLIIGAGFTYVFGKMTGSLKQGWHTLFVMLFLFCLGFFAMYTAELHGNPALNHLPLKDHFTHHAIANFEGKETRFGIAESVLYNQTATATADGGLNSMLASYTATGSLVALINMTLGEVIFGGIGIGLATLLCFILLSVFIGNLMIGRAPEFLGKRIEGHEMAWILVALLTPTLCTLFFTALAAIMPNSISSLNAHTPYEFTTLLYAYTSAAANNGSAFANLNANTDFYNITLGLTMLIGRYAVIAALFFLQLSLLGKQRKPVDKGSLNSHSLLFGVLLVSVIFMIAGLTIFPALALGPLVRY